MNEKMSHPGQRVPDDDEDIELVGTKIEMADDADIREEDGLLRNTRVKNAAAFTTHVAYAWAS